MKFSQEKLKEMLVKPGFIGEKEFLAALGQAEKEQKDLCDVLVEKNYIKDEELGQLLARELRARFVNLRKEKIDEKILHLVPEIVSRDKNLIAFGQEGGKIKVGMREPDNLSMVHILEKRFNRKIDPYYITKADFEAGLDYYRSDIRKEIEEILAKISKNQYSREEGDKFYIKIVDKLLQYGHHNKASDIHIEPLSDRLLIRARIDGIMHNIAKIPKTLQENIVTRIKILSKIRTDEHYSAQDGKFRFNYEKEKIDVRVSVMPVTEGENVVMRLLSGSGDRLSLDNLGFSGRHLNKIRQTIKNPHGMILSTGPTGCGKTTTLYEIIEVLNTESVHIASIEDPVEYDIEGVSQIQVNKKTNLTFANGLRAIVRQDPDIILVGEIRDQETAKIAINSAMTGHLVLSTLHTNDAATTIPRLLDMGIEPFLLASTINLIIGQRLVRKICEKCRYSYEITPEEKQIISDNPGINKIITGKYNKSDINKIRFYAGAGCKVCANTGFSGRIGIYEIMEINSDIKSLIMQRASSEEISKAAENTGMITMTADGVGKVFQGISTFSEVLRVSMA